MQNFAQKKWMGRVVNYSALAAAGLMAEPAMATVITSTSTGFTPVTITGGGPTQAVSFGGSVGAIFQFAAPAKSAGFSFLLQRGPNCALCSANASSFSYNPFRQVAGYVFGTGASWTAVTGGTFFDIAGTDGGNWNGVGTLQGFLGVRFTSASLSSGNHYGFFDVSYDNAPNSGNGTLTINSWAYNDATNGSITAESAVPEPAATLPMGLGLLALGAAGIRARRKKAA